MRYVKQVVASMEKAYAVAVFEDEQGSSFVVGPEKHGPLQRFAWDGTLLETIADGPGGVMTVEQVEGRTDQLVATCEFYSPNFGADDARIVAYTRTSEGTWNSNVVCRLPYVHRFGLMKGTDGRQWLFACTIKDACGPFKEDWRVPGTVWAACVERPLETYSEDDPLPLEPLCRGQVRNHGFWLAPDRSHVLIATAAGVFRYVPPADSVDTWQSTCLIVEPTSDICVGDFDGDGHAEMLTLAPFHGDVLSVWHEGEHEDVYECVWRDEHERPFLHALWTTQMAGQACAVIGHRKGHRELFRVHWNGETYATELIDTGRGPANCLAHTAPDGRMKILAANRETDEIALYDVIGAASTGDRD